MIFRYKVEYEFEAESLRQAQTALNEGRVSEEMAITKSLEAICSDDRIIPKKWTPKKEPSVVEFKDASQSGQEPEDDQSEHIGDDSLGAPQRPSDSSLHEKSGQIEEEEDEKIPF